MTRISPEQKDALVRVMDVMLDAARAAILPYFRVSDLGEDNKEAGGFDPVTEADRAAERAMRAVLAQYRPEDGILGEEFADKPSETGLTWVMDPIDGTRGFISGTPTWGVLLAVSDADGPILGAIDQPYVGERFYGVPQEARLVGPHGERALQTRPCATLGDAILFTTFPEVGSTAERAGFDTIRDQVKLTRYGTDCYAYGLVALGQVDLVIEAGLHPYDICGPIAVIQAAGGIVTDWRGGPAHGGGRVIAAGSAELHRAALDILRDIPEG